MGEKVLWVFQIGKSWIFLAFGNDLQMNLHFGRFFSAKINASDGRMDSQNGHPLFGNRCTVVAKIPRPNILAGQLYGHERAAVDVSKCWLDGVCRADLWTVHDLRGII